MKRIKIFISSVQSEFAEERAMLCHYIRTDVLLGKFFEPAAPMYWNGYIKKVGTGTEDIINKCREYGLETPENGLSTRLVNI